MNERTVTINPDVRNDLCKDAISCTYDSLSDSEKETVNEFLVDVVGGLSAEQIKNNWEYIVEYLKEFFTK